MKKLRRRLPEGEELGLDWERFADGRPWHLKRKRDFADLDPLLAREAAGNAAERMGKAVKTVRDRHAPKKYMWVQFADHEIGLGDPCPCGSRRLLRLHTYFARCAECDAQLILSPSTVAVADDDAAPESDSDDAGTLDDGTGAVSDAAAALLALKEVRLSRAMLSGDREVYRGYGVDGTTPVLLVVEFRTSSGLSLEPRDAVSRAASVQTIPFQQIEGLVDTSALLSRDESEWDLVL